MATSRTPHHVLHITYSTTGLGSITGTGSTAQANQRIMDTCYGLVTDTQVANTYANAGYGRVYGRVNGDVQVLNPLLGPGLILATQCKYAQSPITGTGGCTQTSRNTFGNG